MGGSAGSIATSNGTLAPRPTYHQVVLHESSRETRPQRWNASTAIQDDEEARNRLVAAAIRCIVRRGNARIRIDEVALEAGVARSTVYRYFSGRDELVLGVILSRLDRGMQVVVRSLRHRDDAARSIPDLILKSISMVGEDEVNVALFSPQSQPLVMAVEMSATQILDGLYRNLGPLLERWQADGQLRQDLDLRDTVWHLNAISNLMLAPPWSSASTRAKRSYLQKYVVRALLNP